MRTVQFVGEGLLQEKGTDAGGSVVEVGRGAGICCTGGG